MSGRSVPGLEPDGAAPGPGARRRLAATDVVLGLGLAVAMSPGLWNLLSHWWQDPWARYSALFVPLSIWLATRQEAPARHPRLGIALVAAGLVVQALAVAAVMPALARPAVVVAFVGFALARGLVSPGVAWLALFAVPVPYQLTDWTGGDRVAPELFRTAAQLLRGVGIAVAAGDRHVISGDADLALDSTQAGLPTLFAIAGLVVYTGLRLRLAAGQGARLGAWAAGILAAGAAGHFLAVMLAVGAVAAGSAAIARFCVDSLAWLPTAALVVWAVERSARSGYQRP